MASLVWSHHERKAATGVVLRVVAGYQILLATAVGIHFIITSLYHPGGDEPYTAWHVMDWFMAVSVLMALGLSLGRKRALDSEPHWRDYLEANLTFYGAVLLALWFFWNWFGVFGGQDSGTFWGFINPLFVIVVGSLGFRMWGRLAAVRRTS